MYMRLCMYIQGYIYLYAGCVGAEAPPQVLLFAQQASAPGLFFLHCNFTDKLELVEASPLGAWGRQLYRGRDA